MSTVHVPAPPVPCTRPVASLTDAQLHQLDGGRLALYLVTGKGNRAAGKHYLLEEIPTPLTGRAFRLTPFSTDKLAGDAVEYVVVLDGPDTTCTCPGHSFTAGRKHASALVAFMAEGRLPGRAA
jgi:hypothetical protein